MQAEIVKQYRNMLDSHLSNPEDVFFVQIGAALLTNLNNDPLHHFIQKYGWRGIMVEPTPHLYQELVSYYEGRPEIIIEPLAISDVSEIRQLWYVEENNILPPHHRSVGSFYENNVINQKMFLKHPESKKYITSIDVSCISLSELLIKHSVDRIDVLSIDIEGYDYEVIKQVDFNRYRPEAIIYEDKHLSGRDSSNAKKTLKEQGYSLLPTFDENILAYLENE